jgi:hypothetical protein
MRASADASCPAACDTRWNSASGPYQLISRIRQARIALIEHVPCKLSLHRLQVAEPRLGGPARGEDEVDHVVAHLRVDVDGVEEGAHLQELLRRGDGARCGLVRARRHALDDAPLVVAAGVVDHDLQHEAVDLRLGQRIGALGLDRVLRRHHEERRGHRVRLLADRDLALLHHLEQRRLHLRGRAVDLVGEDEVVEHRTLLEDEAAVLGTVDVAAGQVGGQQIGRELDAVERAFKAAGQGLGKQGFADARYILDQQMTFRQQAMFKIGTVGVAAVKNRVTAAQGPTDASAKPLTKRYAIQKTKLGF